MTMSAAWQPMQMMEQVECGEWEEAWSPVVEVAAERRELDADAQCDRVTSRMIGFADEQRPSEV
jgi:hypothetical protein